MQENTEPTKMETPRRASKKRVYNGVRFELRLPYALHSDLVRLAAADGRSLNAFLVRSLRTVARVADQMQEEREQ